MKDASRHLTIGEVAERSGTSTSALRFYERRGLIHSVRTEGNQRRYNREILRRISVIRIAQNLGHTLEEVERTLAELPKGRTPTQRDWEQLSQTWQNQLDDRIAQLQRVREKLNRCIGCGCLSLTACALHNPDDEVAAEGPGPRFLLAPSDEPSS